MRRFVRWLRQRVCRHMAGAITFKDMRWHFECATCGYERELS